MRRVEADAFVTELREQIVPTIEAQPGFESGTRLLGDGYDNSLSLTLWDSQAHAHAMIDRLGLRANSFRSASVVRLDVREVAAAA